MHSNARGSRPSGKLVALLIAAALALAGFVALGVWQLHRLEWKEALIQRVERHAHASPTAAPSPDAWLLLTRDADEYRRVRLRGRYAHERETLVRASTALGTGYWVLTPLRTADGFWVVVNRGFVPPELRERARRAVNEPTGEQEVIGLLRFSEPRGSLLQSNDAAHDRWYSRDVQSIAVVRGLGTNVAPYFIDTAAGDSANGEWPRAGLTVLNFNNNHLLYAATWFALAAMLACTMGYLVIDERRQRRHVGVRHLAFAAD
jgi:surfeit locus 1 family protein